MKIRFEPGPAVRPGRTKNQKLAWAAASLLAPAALLAWVITAWKLASDLDLSGPFAVRVGILSHWQFWIIFAATLTGGATWLNRYGRSSVPATRTEE